MKRHFTYLILTAGLSALLGTPTLSAQDQIAVADIPFAFQANDTTLAAGKYFVSRNDTLGVLQMRNYAGHSIFVMTYPADEAKVNNPRLSFTCQGEHCVLATLWMPDGRAYAAYKPHQEDLTRKIGLSTDIRSVRMTAK